jgi:hypothetical protein
MGSSAAGEGFFHHHWWLTFPPKWGDILYLDWMLLLLLVI